MTIELVCNATGNPKPRIKWRRVTKQLPSNSRVEQNGKLIFENIQRRDAGEYQCIAESTVGRADSSAIIVVQGIYVCFINFLDGASLE